MVDRIDTAATKPSRALRQRNVGDSNSDPGVRVAPNDLESFVAHETLPSSDATPEDAEQKASHDTRRAFDRAVLSMCELASSLERLDDALRRVRAEQTGHGLTNAAVGHT